MSQKGLKDSTGSKYTTSHEMEQTCGNTAKSSQITNKKRHYQSATKEDSFETTAAGAGQDISMLFSKFADMLSEKAAVDVTQRKELESLLQEAQNLASFLKEKKNHLKQTLVKISDQL